MNGVSEMSDTKVLVLSRYGSSLSRKEFKAIFEWLADRPTCEKETVIDTIKVAFDRQKIIRAMKNLASVGVGRFIAGRRTMKSRFSWLYDLRSIGRVGLGMSAALDSIPESSIAETASIKYYQDMVDYDFQLRPEIRITLTLPRDLDRADVNRLTRYLNSLPFEQTDLINTASTVSSHQAA